MWRGRRGQRGRRTPQVVSNGAVLVDSAETEDWSKALRTIAFDEAARSELVTNALAVAGALTWRRTAEQTVQAYRDAGVVP